MQESVLGAKAESSPHPLRQNIPVLFLSQATSRFSVSSFPPSVTDSGVMSPFHSLTAPRTFHPLPASSTHLAFLSRALAGFLQSTGAHPASPFLRLSQLITLTIRST